MSSIIIMEHPEASLRVCRGCLATDRRLHDMRQNRLMEAYSTLMKPVKVPDDLPHYLCGYCAVLLLKCDTFRTKCYKTLALLKNVKSKKKPLNLEQIKQLKVPPFFNQSEIKTIDISEYIDNKEIKVEDDEESDIFHGIEDQFEIKKDIDSFETKLDVVIENKPEFTDNYDNRDDDNESDSDNDNNDSNSDGDNSDEEQDNNSDTSINKTKIKPELISKRKNIKRKNSKAKNTQKPCNTNFIKKILDIAYSGKRIKLNEDDRKKILAIKNEYESKLKDSNITEDILLNKLPKKILERDDVKAILQKNLKSTKKERDTNRKDLKMKRKEDLKINFEQFCVTYNVNVVELSREEQLKEIEDRKESTNYQRANFRCNICYKGYLVKESFNNHMFQHDAISGAFICDICNIHLLNSNELVRHKHIHRRKYHCKDCGFISRNRCQVMAHHRWHGGSRYKCKHCNKEFNRQSTYCGHMKASHPTSDLMVRCEICGAIVLGQKGLSLHERKVHVEMKSPECLCSGCGTQFYCSGALKAHRDAGGVCSPRAKYCVRCGAAFETQLQLEEHEAEQQKTSEEFKCEECNKCFKNYSRYSSHMKYSAKHTTAPKGTLSFRTKVTDKSSNKSPTKNFICDLCGKLFANIHYLQAHQLSHSSDRPFKCSECPKTFKGQQHLRTHMHTHKGERPYPCDICNKAYASKSNLARHNMLVHTGERPFACDVCGKSFQCKSSVQLHIKTVHMKIRLPPRIRNRNKKTD